MKKNIYFLFFIISLFAFISCNQNNNVLKNKFSLVKTNDTISIKLDSDEQNLSTCIRYLRFNDFNLLAVNNGGNNSIDIYDINTGRRFKRINIEREGANGFPDLVSFSIVNMDSILLFSMGIKTIGIIDGNGAMLDRIDYSKDKNGRIFTMSLISYGNGPFVSDSLVFFEQMHEAHSSQGILKSTKQRNSNVCVSVNLKTKESVTLPLLYPEELIEKDITNMYVNFTLGYNNCLVYTFGILDKVYYSSDHIKFHNSEIKTNYDLSLPENQFKYLTDFSKMANYLLTHDLITNIHYDKYRECYYLIIRKRIKDSDIDNDLQPKFMYPNSFIVILDKNFNFLGDAFFEDNAYSFKMMFITEKGVYISEDHILNSTFNEDIMRFRLFKLERSK